MTTKPKYTQTPLREGIMIPAKFNRLLELHGESCEIFAAGNNTTIENLFPGEHIKYSYTECSIKSFFLPQRETLFLFQRSQNGEILKIKEMEPATRCRVLLGVPPCEVMALAILDAVFMHGDTIDPGYMEKRKNTTIISFACRNAGEHCFCTAVGGDPFHARGQDILVIQLDKNTLYIKIFSESGMEFFGKSHAPDPPSEQHKEYLDEIYERVLKELPEKSSLKDLNPGYDNPVWQKLAEGCIGCAVCAYMCPTCHCFDTVDEMHGNNGQRIRIWDTCQFSYYTREASGHNPRAQEHTRMRQRVLHKLSYIPTEHGISGCVGCGRCIRHCPTNTDMREIINTLQMVNENTV